MFKFRPVSVEITHIADPHRFWYIREDGDQKQFDSFERDLQQFIEASSVNSNEPLLLTAGTIAAIYHVEQQKWVRVRIENVDAEHQVTVFAIDYGYVARIVSSDLVKLNDWLGRITFDRIALCGLINVVPTADGGRWPEIATEKLRDTCSQAEQCIFIPRKKREQHNFGDLFISMANGIFLNAHEVLIGIGVAKRTLNFEKELQYCTQNNDHVEEQTATLNQSSQQSDDINESSTAVWTSIDCSTDVKANTDKSLHQRPNNGTPDGTHIPSISNGDSTLKLPDHLTDIEPQSIFNKIQLSMLLAHAKLSVRPIKNRESAPFHNIVLRALQQFKELYAVQSWAWPHVARNNSLVIVDGSGRGKTFAYVPAICSVVQYNFEANKDLNEAADPAVVVISPNHDSLTKIVKMFKHFLPGHASTVVEAGVNRVVDEVVIDIWNGCNVLVCTPKILAGIISTNKFLLRNQKVIQHVVYDNVNLIRKNFPGEYEKIRQWQQKGLKSAQIIATSRHWDPQLIGLLRLMRNPLLIIGNHVEAFLYGRPKFEITICDASQKIEKAKQYLNAGNYTTLKTMIVCTSDEEVAKIADELQKVGVSCLAYNSHSVRSLGRRINWCVCSSKPHSVLICCDAIIRDLYVRTARVIIHYSLPEEYENFVYRFSASLDCIHNFMADNSASTESNQLESFILLDDSNSKELPKIIELFERYDEKKIPPAVRSLSEKLRITTRAEKACCYTNLCSAFVIAGAPRCHDQCDRRHALGAFDAPPENFPTQGWVKVSVLHIHSPVHYAMRVLEHFSGTDEKTWQPINDSKRAGTFFLKFQFGTKDLEQIDNKIQIGDKCVVYDSRERPQRGQIVRRRQGCQLFENTEFDIKLIDNGMWDRRPAKEIYQIPAEFTDFPAQAIDVHLVHMEPKDITWTRESLAVVKNTLSTSIDSGMQQQIQIHVIMGLNNTLIVDYIRVMEGYGTFRVARSVCKTLKPFVTINRDMFTKFKDIAKDIGLLSDAKLMDSKLSTAAVLK